MTPRDQMRSECTECGGSPGDSPPCGCGREQRARIEDDERFEAKTSDVSFTSVTVLRTVADMERAIDGLFAAPTREELLEVARFGPATRQGVVNHVMTRRLLAVSKREARNERHELSHG